MVLEPRKDSLRFVRFVRKTHNGFYIEFVNGSALKIYKTQHGYGLYTYEFVEVGTGIVLYKIMVCPSSPDIDLNSVIGILTFRFVPEFYTNRREDFSRLHSE